MGHISVVDQNGLTTTYFFQYGTTTAYGTTVPAGTGAVGSDSASHTVNQAISGLDRDQAYHYRIAATNSLGTTYGSDRTFTTAR